ncbi:DUF4145 domain-containing protein [Spartinivicinus poritis]|uniref:DUF4145 domain-containing protein n=1 Tax=Spartinivicinus poritis TaxID=2994640 RepID=A0ABT5UBI6_9GAMM|nr:DUF4145 domain-containing protein [Spartinivicinus sp. A2-2]MDE1463745.1 DUF4145 domain-containing protein [Spartinivicinus sp. A2-2]
MKDTKNNNSSGSNFWFLKEHDPMFMQLAITAEQAFAGDPNTALMKLRQLGEALAQDIAVRCGIQFDNQTTQADLLFKINREINLDPAIRGLFHTLRIEGNKATHQFKTKHKEAMDGLKVARAITVWFHQSFGKQGTNFKPGPFTLPSDPSQQLRDLQTQIAQLKGELSETSEQLDSNKYLAELEAKEKAEYAALAEQMDIDARHFEQQAKQYEEELIKQQQEFNRHLEEKLQKRLAEQSKQHQQALKQVSQRTQQASNELALNEEFTRILIDQQLVEAG